MKAKGLRKCICSKHKVNKSQDGHEARERRHFNREEALALAKAWINQSNLGPGQSYLKMWEGIAEYVGLNHRIKRTALLLKSKWQVLQRETRSILLQLNMRGKEGRLG